MGYSFLKSYAVSGRHYDPDKEISKVIASGTLGAIRALIVSNDSNIKAHHIEEIIDSPIPSERCEVAKSYDNINQHQLTRLINDPHPMVRRAAANNKIASSSDLHTYLDRELSENKPHIPPSIMNHPNLNTQHLDRIITHPDYTVRAGAVMSIHANQEHISRGVSDDHYAVRWASIPKAVPNQLKKLSMDENIAVSRLAKETMEYRPNGT